MTLKIVFENIPSTALAISGGSDSMALALLVQDWARPRNIPITALTVDHGLRPNSRSEAEQVAEWMHHHGIPHHILTWEGEKPTANLQAIARNARYRLLTGWCRDNGVSTLMAGHQADDQIETFLLRLMRGSGVQGLAAMRPTTMQDGIQITRPLLRLTRQQLRDYLTARGQPWLDDPSNTNPRFDRVKMRQLLAQMQNAGIRPQRIQLAIHNLQRASDALEQVTEKYFSISIKEQTEKYVVLHEDFITHPAEIALRILALALQQVNGQPYPPRLQPLERLLSERCRIRRTLHGCIIEPVPRGVRIRPEGI